MVVMVAEDGYGVMGNSGNLRQDIQCSLIRGMVKEKDHVLRDLMSYFVPLDRSPDCGCVCCGGWLLFGECSTGRRLPVPRCNIRAYRTTHHCGDWRGSLLEEVAFAGSVCPRYQLPLSAILGSHSRQLRENPAIRRSGALCPRCLHEECQSLLLGKVMSSGKNGDGGDLLLFRDGPRACDVRVIGSPERLASQVFLEWNVPWWLPVLGSCQVSLLQS
ncbi:hypothetical protein Tco_0847706 [Tanacetum coccineum]